MAQYQWPCWWGGVAASENPPLIAEQLKKLRDEVGFLKAEKKQGGPKFAIKSAKELMEKLRPALDKLNMVCFTTQLTGGNIPLTPVVDEDGDVVAGEGTLAFLMATVRIGSADGSYVDVVGAGHGADSQDKAGGKSSTYAWKDSLIKGLSLPDDEMVDTDDEETPIRGGLRQRGKAPGSGAKSQQKPAVTLDEVSAKLEGATTKEELAAARKLAQQLPADQQTKLVDLYNAKRAELAK